MCLRAHADGGRVGGAAVRNCSWTVGCRAGDRKTLLSVCQLDCSSAILVKCTSLQFENVCTKHCSAVVQASAAPPRLRWLPPLLFGA